jgi:hypothetical protein
MDTSGSRNEAGGRFVAGLFLPVMATNTVIGKTLTGEGCAGAEQRQPLAAGVHQTFRGHDFEQYLRDDSETPTFGWRLFSTTGPFVIACDTHRGIGADRLRGGD